MKVLLVFIYIFVAVRAMSWEDYKIKFNKIYSSATEEAQRKATFVENVRKIEDHNVKFARRKVSYRVAVNHLADMTSEEFRRDFSNFKVSKKGDKHPYQPKGDAPLFLDWTKRGAVTGVKDEGLDCTSSWAYSATGSIEGQYFLKNGNLISFSEQQLVDCSEGYDNNGCRGGITDHAFDYLKDNGLETEAIYPYIDAKGACNYQAGNVTLKGISSYVDIAAGDENALHDAVVNIGPISAAIDGSQWSFQFYTAGVYVEPACTTTLTRGILIVGYGTEDGLDYWLVKNSWGIGWGISGFIKMSRNAGNQCGIADMASYPVL